MRCLVAVHYIDLALLIAKPATDLNFSGWETLKSDLICAFKGFWFLNFLPQTFTNSTHVLQPFSSQNHKRFDFCMSFDRFSKIFFLAYMSCSMYSL